MKKRVFSFLMMVMAVVLGCASAHAQGMMPQLTPLPEMPGMRTGKLPNGLTYYVLHNEEPKGRANFYIAQKVGSTLETKDQLGLAHFLEHMAFNGTVTYPGKAMLTYLQNKGIRFGEDINAQTGFDETIYNINNIPTNDVPLMDSVLLVLRDWSCNLLLEDDEIEAERGVIQEEWRSRNDAQVRMYTQMLPAVYEEYQYQQMPIGTMDVVMNFKPDVLRDYYHKWYRPDQQGIIIVGDFDAEEMEKKVIDLFSPIKMPENVPERVYAEVSDNKELIYFEFEDPEVRQANIRCMFKSDVVPFEIRNTAEMFINNYLLKSVISQLLNNRLKEYAHEEGCRYQSAFTFFDNYFVSRTKDAFTIYITPKDNIEEAFADAMSVVARACKTGFTDSELERVDSEIISLYERAYNERDKTDTDARAQEIIEHFVSNSPAPGAEMEYQMVSTILPQLPVQMINEVVKTLLTDDNQVITVTQQQAPGKKLPGKAKMAEILNSMLAAEYEAYVDEVITEPLLKKAPVNGSILSEKAGQFGTTEFMLSNGMKVIVKPTDFTNDQILMHLWSENGFKYWPASEAADLNLLSIAYDASRLGNYDSKTLTKYLAGKQLTLGAGMGIATFTYSGQSTVKDFPTLMELLYASMTDISTDDQQYNRSKENIVRQLGMMVNNPDFIFSNEYTKTLYGNNAMMNSLTVEAVEGADYNKMVDIIRQASSNAADFTMVLVGNIDLNTLRPLLEQYVASLPSNGQKTVKEVITPIEIPTGVQTNIYDQPMQSPLVKLLGGWDGKIAYTVQNESMIDILAQVLSNIYTLTLREEMGGTYSPGAFYRMLPNSEQWLLAYYIDTNNEVGQAILDRAVKEAKDLVENGAKADMFGQVREASVNQLSIALRTNDYWLENLQKLERGNDFITGHEEFLKNLTLDEFNAFIKENIKFDNRIDVEMIGVKAE